MEQFEYEENEALDTQDTQEIYKIRKMNEGASKFDIIKDIIILVLLCASAIVSFVFGKKYFYFGFIFLSLFLAYLIYVLVSLHKKGKY